MDESNPFPYALTEVNKKKASKLTMSAENYANELASVRNSKLCFYFSYHKENEFSTNKTAFVYWSSCHCEYNNMTGFSYRGNLAAFFLRLRKTQKLKTERI